MRPPSSCYFLVKVLSGAMQWTYKTPTYMWYKPRFCMTKNIAGTIQLPISLAPISSEGLETYCISGRPVHANPYKPNGNAKPTKAA